MEQNPLHINKIQAGFIIFFLTVFIISKFFLPQETKESEPVAIIPHDPFASLVFEAKAAYVFDAATGMPIFAYNEELQLPLASVTKIMTAAVATALVPKETIITIGNKAIAKEGDTGLLSGERWTLSDLIDLTLVTSSNDGAAAIAAALGRLYSERKTDTEKSSPAFAPIDVQEEDAKENEEKTFVFFMNEAATALGMAQTFFLNESGLDAHPGLSGAYGSAKDMAILFDYLLKTNPDALRATRYSDILISSLNDISHEAKNTNKTLATLPSIIASKTGFTDIAGGNLIVAFEVGPMHPVIVAVLGSGIDTRFEDVEKLVWASVEKIAQ